MTENQNTKSQPVLVAGSALAALTALSGALSALVLNNIYVGIFAAVVAALNIGVAAYVKSQVVPFVDAAAYKNDSGVIIAGPASSVQNGTYAEVVAIPTES